MNGLKEVIDTVRRIQSDGYRVPSHIILPEIFVMQVAASTMCAKANAHNAPPPPSFMGIPMQQSKILPPHVYGILVFPDGSFVQIVSPSFYEEYTVAQATFNAQAEKNTLMPTVH